MSEAEHVELTYLGGDAAVKHGALPHEGLLALGAARELLDNARRKAASEEMQRRIAAKHVEQQLRGVSYAAW